jgi:thiol-disulfide isomerase/thioredoxin
VPRSRTGLVGRLGAAVIAPRAAFALADDPREAGRAGTDLFVLLIIALVAVHTRELVAASWLGAVIDGALGLRTAVDVVARGVTTTLALLLIAAVAIWLGAGRQRAVGRDFDLACVAVLPMVIVEVVATLITRAAQLELPHGATLAVLAIGGLWSAGLVVLAAQQARTARDEVAIVATPAPRAGAALIGLAALLLGINTAWVVTHLDWLRPMQSGDRAPSFALPRIEERGALGEPITSDALAGHVVVLDFWATWCRPCLRALPSLSALAARGEVTVLSVNLDDPAAARARFDDEHNRSTLVAGDDDTATRFGVHAIPHLVVIDQDGMVRQVSRGDGALGDAIDLATDLSKR